MEKKRTYSKRRLITIGVVSTLIIGSGVLSVIRWNAWFGNKPEVRYHTPNSIDRVTITPGQNFSSERTISWRCGEIMQKSWLEYGLAGEDTTILDKQWIPAIGRDIITRSGHGYFYQAKIAGLKEGKQYRYRVHTGKQSSIPYVINIPKSRDSSNFIYIGDVQDPDGKMSRRLFADLERKNLSIDFLAVAGDQIEGPTDSYWNIWYNSLSNTWSGQIPIIAATGNHEYLKKGLLRELDPRWTVQYGFPQNGPSGFIGRSYYVDFPLMRFIVIDSNGISSPLDIIRHRSWLKERLQTSSQPWQIVMFHHAIHTIREGRFHPMMYYGLKGILEKDGADLVLQGHDHAYSRITTKTEQGDSIAPIYIVSSSSPKVYRNGFNEIHDRLGSGLQLYQYIQVNTLRLRYQSFKYSGELYDDVELVHASKNENRIKAVDYARSIPEEFHFSDFANTPKGKKKALKYKEAIQEYLSRRRNKIE